MFVVDCLSLLCSEQLLSIFEAVADNIKHECKVGQLEMTVGLMCTTPSMKFVEHGYKKILDMHGIQCVDNLCSTAAFVQLQLSKLADKIQKSRQLPLLSYLSGFVITKRSQLWLYCAVLQVCHEYR